MKTQLRETLPFEYRILEARGTVKRPGVLMSLEGTIQRADMKNANSRVYPRKLWDGIMRDSEINERLTNRRMVGMLGHPACLTSDDFRVFTLDGWKEFKDIKVGDKVWSRREGSAIVSTVENIVNDLYVGPAYQISNKCIDSGFTPNHRLLVTYRPDANNGGKVEEYVAVREVYEHPERWGHSAIPKTAVWPEVETVDAIIIPGVERKPQPTKNPVWEDLKLDPKLFAAFMGVYLAEGTLGPSENQSYTVTICQKIEWTCAFIWNEILSKFPEELKWREVDSGFQVTDKRLWTYLSKLGNQYVRYIPKEIKNLNAACLKELLFWFNIGDGSISDANSTCRIACGDQSAKEIWAGVIREDGHQRYVRRLVYSVSKTLIDDLHECLVRSGGSGTLSVVYPDRDYIFAGRVIEAKNKSPLYKLNISAPSYGTWLLPRSCMIREFQHSGNVYCLTTTHGNFYMEQNGRSFWTGNSGSTSEDSISHVVTEHKLLPDGRVVGRMDILNTPKGQIAATLFEAGVQLGVSSRGDGSVEKKGDLDEVQEDYRLETYDLVLKPSTPGAYPQITESEQKQNQELIASAVEGLVKSTEDVTVLLECHKIISVLEGCESRCEPIISSIKSKLTARNDQQQTEVSTMANPSVAPSETPQIALSPEMARVINGMVDKGVLEAVAQKDAVVAKLNETVVEHTTENKDLRRKLEAAERLIDEFTRKVKDLSENKRTDETLAKRYDAAVRLLDEAVTRLKEMGHTRRKLRAAESLLGASITRHKTEAVNVAINKATRGIAEGQRKQVRSLLAECKSPAEVASKFKTLASLLETRKPTVREPLPKGKPATINETARKPKDVTDLITSRLLARVG